MAIFDELDAQGFECGTFRALRWVKSSREEFGIVRALVLIHSSQIIEANTSPLELLVDYSPCPSPASLSCV